ncbi:GL11059 [Drosophila persimilis]|uniref:Craniofacial development protein 1 n=1 Tax=Drosophila persimilis TaxID=7234 RepID=B4GBJ4_DROPE|nr:craniofacial development protein 1 [Drosophila persimilis]EDW31289.1 GL11059 [Drosophila persimilis]
MNKEEEYTSESENDEDYCIDGENVDSGSDDDSINNDADSENYDSDDKPSKSTKNQKKHISSNVYESESSIPRKTRQADRNKNDRINMEKDELESDEETDKSRSNALWADFLSDVGTEKQIQHKTKSVETPVEPTDDTKIASKKLTPAIIPREDTSKCLNTIFDVEKSKDSTNAKENQQQPVATSSKCFSRVSKRPQIGSGVGSFLNQLGKKKKLSVLEKSQMDWKTFKTDEGINEQLSTHNKGKDGYLERQDFLQRTDLRQFEIEKNLRQTRRQN